jgi:uncharacterized protein
LRRPRWPGSSVGRRPGAATPVPDPTLAAALGLLLGPGEAEAIALAAQRRCRVILDDHQARSVATRINVEVIGTVGVLLLSKRNGLVPAVGPLLEALDTAGFRVDERLRRRALELADEAPGEG